MKKALKMTKFSISKSLPSYFFDKLLATVILFLLASCLCPENPLSNCSSTKVLLVSFTTAALLRGLFNVNIYKEYNAVVLEAENNSFSLEHYMLKIIIEMVIYSLVESMIATVIFLRFFGNSIISKAIPINKSLVLYAIFLFSIICASAFGILTSSIFFEKSTIVNSIYVLINITLSGCVFQVTDKIQETISKFTVCHYSASALGAEVNINQIPPKYPLVPQPFEKLFESTQDNLLFCSTSMVCLTIVFLSATYPILKWRFSERTR